MKRILTRSPDLSTSLACRLRLLLDAQKHTGTTRQLELALLGDEDNDADRLSFSDMLDANPGQIVGATRV